MSTIGEISSVNSSKINLNTASKAFEAAKKPAEKQSDFKEEDIALMEKPKAKVDIEDIQKYADYMGEKLTIEDINYGLMYGRSVIADFSA